MDYFPKVVAEFISLTLSTLPKAFHPAALTIKKLSFMTSTGLPTVELESRLHLAVDRWSDKGTLEMLSSFSIVFVLRDNLLPLTSPGRLPGLRLS